MRFCGELLLIVLNVITHHFGSGQIIFQDDDLWEGSSCRTSEQEDGVCTKISMCPDVKPSRSDICVFQGSDPIICCPAKKLNIINESIGRLSEQVCAANTEKNIDVSSQKKSHVAAIGWTQSDGTIDWKCAGTLIYYNFIITAARCSSIWNVKPDIVRLGDINLMKKQENLTSIDFDIEKIIVHPEYKRKQMYHDIALFKISPKNGLINTFTPVCIFSKSELPEENFTLTTSGYGALDFLAPRLNKLHQSSVILIENSICEESYKFMPKKMLPKNLIDSQVCVQDPTKMRDSCQGDSGGPLEISVGSQQYLLGISSFCFGTTPGIFTKLYSYLDWIENEVWP